MALIRIINLRKGSNGLGRFSSLPSIFLPDGFEKFMSRTLSANFW